MKRSIIKTILIAITLLLSASLSLAADPQRQKATQIKTDDKAKATAKDSKAASKAALVDINSATKEQLKKLPGISDADADKIIAGRPYLTKAHLQTHNIISPGVYQGLRQLVIAKQKQTPVAKAVKK